MVEGAGGAVPVFDEKLLDYLVFGPQVTYQCQLGLADHTALSALEWFRAGQPFGQPVSRI